MKTALKIKKETPVNASPKAGRIYYAFTRNEKHRPFLG